MQEYFGSLIQTRPVAKMSNPIIDLSQTPWKHNANKLLLFLLVLLLWQLSTDVY
jgi:hypothetical protein